ncbi:T9SS type A sorting domain-containing protein [Saccharicrinis sp. FJH54]|uniref:T9SS type A sorting domain-containing protein n=1 Tax=Saccharicrinis sp. FJH54 TaxID=3344665 RepID=UPI0035D5201F
MKYSYKSFLFVIILSFFTDFGYSQITYIELSIKQPGLEDCLYSAVMESDLPSETISIRTESTTGQFTISINKFCDESNLLMAVYDIYGKTIFTEILMITDEKTEKLISLNRYSPGIYILSLSSDSKFYRSKIILR